MSAPILAAPGRADADRLRTHLDTFAGMSEPGGGAGVTRLAYTPLERAAHDVYASHMRALGLDVRTDTAGNTIAELPGTTPDCRAWAPVPISTACRAPARTTA